MDNLTNNPVPPPTMQIPQAPQVPPMPTATPPASAPEQPKGGHKTFLYVFVSLFVIITGLMVLMVLFSKNEPTSQVTEARKTTPSVTQPVKSAEEKEAESIDVTDRTSSELSPVEKDLNSL